MPQNDENERLKSTGVNRRQFITRTAAGAAGAVALTSVLDACGGSSSTASSTTDAQSLTSTAWKFGVMSDTQWTNAPGTVWTTPAGVDNSDPDTSAVSIATQIQEQFINAGVKFVVHVGDLADNTSSSVANTGEDTRALYAQPLYNAGIGFFPLRGNHDDNYAGLGAEFQRIFPQAQNGAHNSTPSDILTTFATTDPQVSSSSNSQAIVAKTGSAFTVGSNFSSPDPWGNSSLKGLTYSFDYNNARFILLDQFTPVNPTTPFDASYGGGSPTTINLQQSWINSQLSGRASGSHAFVFSHKGLITCQHADGLFGNDPSQNLPYQNAFIDSLAQYNVGYYMNGHDHMYDRALIQSPDAKAKVMTLLTASDSSKFYVPAGSGTNCSGNTVNGSKASTPVPFGSTNDIYYNGLVALPSRRTPITQELNTVGYYIFTVNGANVTVDYYSADVSAYTSSASEMIVSTATGLNFVKRESFGYSLIGKQFELSPAASYASGAVQLTYPLPATATPVQIQDSSSSGNTTAAILSGTNNSNLMDASKQPCSKVVTTGWMSKSGNALSDILALSGINPYVNGGPQPDVYTLSLKVTTPVVSAGVILCSLDSTGNWSNAVNQNSGGTKNFVNGPWKSSYGLGTYGVDPTTNSAWAVLNYDGAFAVAPGA
ncbi:MAG: metallophosphoesterase [Candidatus Korobacteraceae bacterium]|jgi:hypothetical protein